MPSEDIERNKEIVTSYMFGDLTMEKIGNKYDLSRERIRQILQRYGVFGSEKLVYLKARVYDFLIDYKRQNDGNTPVVRDIRDGAKTSTTSRVHQCLEGLEEDGLITIRRTKTGTQTIRFISIVGATWLPPKEFLEGDR